jgi:hypothetical protein
MCEAPRRALAYQLRVSGAGCVRPPARCARPRFLWWPEIDAWTGLAMGFPGSEPGPGAPGWARPKRQRRGPCRAYSMCWATTMRKSSGC